MKEMRYFIIPLDLSGQVLKSVGYNTEGIGGVRLRVEWTKMSDLKHALSSNSQKVMEDICQHFFPEPKAFSRQWMRDDYPRVIGCEVEVDDKGNMK